MVNSVHTSLNITICGELLELEVFPGSVVELLELLVPCSNSKGTKIHCAH